MDAIQYLKNQMILENCKEYLKLLDFLPEQDEIWNSINKSKPSEVIAYQNFRSTKNCVEITFYIRSMLGEMDNLTLRAKVVNNRLSKITIFKTGLGYDKYPNLTRTVDFMNNDVCKVVEDFKDNTFWTDKEVVSYYVRKKLVHTSLSECVFDKRFVRNTEFVEQATTPVCGTWYHDVKYGRNYVENVCYRQKYFEDKETLSHNQFEKKNKGVLKRVKKLGQTLEK